MKRKPDLRELANSKSALEDELIVRILLPFGVAINHHLAGQIRTYIQLLLVWSEKVGLTTIRAPREILEKHFGESFFGAGVASISRGRLADVGSGAGFPGLPIKLLVPEVEVILIEANNRKVAFLKEVIRRLGLSGVRVEISPFQDLNPRDQRFDYVCCRALGRFRELLSWAASALVRGGRLILWVGASDARELAKNCDWVWRQPVLIPGSKQRVILVGSPVGE